MTENVIFIVLNVVFIAILLIFVFSRLSNGAALEEKYAKQVALIIDASEPGMAVHLNMEDAIGVANSNKFPLNQVITIDGNLVTLKLSQKGGYSYSFFNNVSVSQPVFDSQNQKEYYFVIQK